MTKKINLVLGGGGASGIASIGVLIELITNGYSIPTITGTSAGALLGGLYAVYKESLKGNTRPQIKQFYDMITTDFDKFKDRDYFNFINFYIEKLIRTVNYSEFGIYKGQVLHSWLLEKTEYLTFADLKKTDLYITACEATTGTLIVFSKHTTPDIRIADAIRASCSIQAVFKPFKIKAQKLKTAIFLDNSIKSPYKHDINTNHPLHSAIEKNEDIFLQDGGNLGNMRLDIASQICEDCKNDQMIGVSYTYNNELQNMNQANSILSQTINIMMNASEKLIHKYIQLKDKYNNTVIISPKSDVGATDFELSIEKKIELIDIGRAAIKNGFINLDRT